MLGVHKMFKLVLEEMRLKKCKSHDNDLIEFAIK